ncbi:MAG: DinB family protein [Anaerolineae bacterium]|jgi:hypothetical protein|nr:DinB family protein [Anaerolineae bacterium]
MSFLYRIAGGLIFDLPARRRSAADLIQDLSRGQQEVLARLQAVPEQAEHHRVATHIIGIERWAAARLKVAQGAALSRDEYDAYRPARSTPWADLPALFSEARGHTLALAQSLTPAQLQQRVWHNMYAELSVAGWLRYIHLHAGIESRRLRP